MNLTKFIKSRLNAYSSNQITVKNFVEKAKELAKKFNEEGGLYLDTSWDFYSFKDNSIVESIVMHSSKHESSDEVPFKWEGVDTYLDQDAETECRLRGAPGQASHTIYVYDKNGEAIGTCGHAWGWDWDVLVKFGKEVIKEFGLDPNSVKPKD